MTPRIDPLTQRVLAQTLRYQIDQSQMRGDPHIEIVRSLIAENPHAFRSRHVQHNLGLYRLEWLREQGMA